MRRPTLFTDNEVIYSDMARVLDAIRLRHPGDPVFVSESQNGMLGAAARQFLFPKVVIGDIVL